MAKESSMWSGFEFSNDLSISILQCAEDTILIGRGGWDNLWGCKTTLRAFELMSVLKVNFAKSNLFGLNLSDEFLEAASQFLSYKICLFSFNFLRILVGANSRRYSSWKPIVDGMKEGGLRVKIFEIFNLSLLSMWK